MKGRTHVSVEVRVCAELNDLLSPNRRGRPILVEVATGTTVKDLAESLGVPHTEIDVILVNGESVGFAHQVVDGDRVSLYPEVEALDVSPVVRLRPTARRQPRFVLDVHLGRLARYLRLLGFDATWRNDANDEELVDVALQEKRTLLTRDRGLLKRSAVTHGYFVRETDRRRQILEVLRRFDLFDAIEPFGRCLECNGLLEPVTKAEVEHRLPPRTRRDYDDFQQCSECRRVYWQGSHYDRLRAVVDDIRRESRDDTAHRPYHGLARAARAAWGRGWSVVPLHSVAAGRCSCGDRSCPAPGKHPRIAWDQRMHDAATRDEVDRWWRRWPQANVGVVTGAVSGLVVLDVDPRHGGGDTVAELEAFHGALPPTVESFTGGGGQHFYFRHPGIRVPSRPVAPGLDVKGDGGLVVSPPSLHVSGRVYGWEAGCAPGDVALAETPPWLLGLVVDPGGSASSPHRTAREIPPRTESERREFAQLWAQVGVAVQPGDHNYLCPFHPDHHPSLHVDAEGCRFYCFGCARGGGTGRLRRLVGTGHEAPGLEVSETGASDTSDATEPSSVPITLPGDDNVEVVGESRYQDTLLELTGGRRHYGGVHMATVARLVPEPGNAADPGAIVVTIGGRTVGYLSRADSAHHREAIDAAIDRHGQANCTAVIVGGWEREHGDVGYFGVHLRLTVPHTHHAT